MDANGVKAPQEPKDVPSMMREMMEMCCSGEFSPADMCRRMMHSMGGTSDAEAQPAPQSGTASDEPGSSGEDEPHSGCCGPRSRHAPERR